MSKYDFDYEEKGGKAKKIACWVAIVLAAVLIISAFVAISIKIDSLETHKTLSASAYKVGVLDDTTGKFDADSEDKSAIFTEDYITVNGLSCILSEDAEITYQINWYAENKTFLIVSTHTDNFNALVDEVPEGAEYCKIEIIPNGDNDDSISNSELKEYAGMLTVKYAKN